jgi:glucose/mannose transport system substrate-binding protein
VRGTEGSIFARGVMTQQPGFSKYNGHWIASPVNMHSTSGVWISKSALDAAGGKAPETWEDLVSVQDAMRANGITPLAQGGQLWQDSTMFDGVMLSLGGGFYKAAMVDLEPTAPGGKKVAKAFTRLMKLRTCFDDNFSGRDWNLASAMVINGEAGMQMMGDWAKGEFVKAGKLPGTDFVGIRFRGTQGSVTFNSDQFAMFTVASDGAKAAQSAMGSAIESPVFRSAFNVVKGSVPARADVPDTAFDDCGRKGIKDLDEANSAGTLHGSAAQGHAAAAAVKNALYEIVTAAANGEYATGADAGTAPAAAVAAAW